MQTKRFKTKCDFCRYWTGRSCMVTPNTANCREATREYYQQLKGVQQAPVKSFRSWDRK